MHVLFKEDVAATAAGRRLLVKVGAYAHAKAGAWPQTEILRVAIATELNIPTAELAATSYAESGGVVHTELMFKGLDSLKLGYELETAVLANQGNPIPGYPIRRLYMEEIFDCGAHAVQATHSQPIDRTLPFTVSDLPNGGFVHH